MTLAGLAATACGLSHTVILNAENNTAGVKLAENIDTQPRNANATKNMTNQPKVDNSLHWENPKICATCIHYKQNRCNLTAFHFSPNHPACPRYIAKKTE